MPYKYKTNEKGDGGIVFHRIAYPSAEDTKQAIRSFEVQLGWIAETLFRNGDIRGAVRAALLHRYFFNDETDPVSLIDANPQRVRGYVGEKDLHLPGH